MKIEITSTDIMTSLDGVPVRLWEGITQDGTRCRVFVHRVALAEAEDADRFDRELREQMPPGRHVPLSMIL